MTTVSIVEDDRAFAGLLIRYIRTHPELKLLSLSQNGIEALADISRCKPRVVLMDINLPRMNGIDCIRELKKLVPPLATQFLILTDYDDSHLIFEAISAGALGYLLKNDTHTEKLQGAINDVLAGEAPMSAGIARRLIEHFQHPPATPNSLQKLSERERQILHHLSQGHTSKEIAFDLGISIHTVGKHITSIYAKLQVNNRVEAIKHFLGQ